MSAIALLWTLVGLTALQRGIELVRARRHAGRLLARGGVEHGRGHYPWLVAAHVAYFVALVLETYRRRPPPPGAATIAWLTVLALAEVARLWVLSSLGERWTTRVVVLPGAPLVRRGPYRWIAHPNYVVVVLEQVAMAAALGAWGTLLLALVLQTLVLTVRIRVESRALATAARRVHLARNPVTWRGRSSLLGLPRKVAVCPPANRGGRPRPSLGGR